MGARQSFLNTKACYRKRRWKYEIVSREEDGVEQVREAVHWPELRVSYYDPNIRTKVPLAEVTMGQLDEGCAREPQYRRPHMKACSL